MSRGGMRMQLGQVPYQVAKVGPGEFFFAAGYSAWSFHKT
jgi:hypothetical protein